MKLLLAIFAYLPSIPFVNGDAWEAMR